MTMQQTPLLMSRILGRGAILDPEVEVVTQQADGTHRQTLQQTWDRANQVAHALKAHGIGVGDRIGSFMWNNYRHLELYQGVPSMGAVLHTLNIRLSPTDLRKLAFGPEKRGDFHAYRPFELEASTRAANIWKCLSTNQERILFDGATQMGTANTVPMLARTTFGL